MSLVIVLDLVTYQDSRSPIELRFSLYSMDYGSVVCGAPVAQFTFDRDALRMLIAGLGSCLGLTSGQLLILSQLLEQLLKRSY